MERDLRYVEPGAGAVYRVLGGDEVTVKAAGADTGGAFAVFETRVPPRGGPPPHVHHREDEAFYVLEGEFAFRVGDRDLRATAGAFLWAPRDLPHVFRNVGPAPARLLVVVRPAGFERFLEEFSRLPPDPAAMAAVAAKYGLEFLDLPETEGG